MNSDNPEDHRTPRRADKARTGGGASDLESLLHAILDDDHARARKLLEREPGLSIRQVDEARLYESQIIHWIYAHDTALHLAAAGHRAVIAQMLLAAGADPNSARNHRQGRPLHYAADGHPQSPLFDAARQVDTIRILLGGGADLHAIDKNGATALHRAVRTRSAAAVECLIQAGANPSAANRSGATPFHLAVQNTGRGGTGDEAAKAAQRRIIKFMLAHGASPRIKDTRGRSVYDWATTAWVQRLLRSA